MKIHSTCFSTFLSLIQHETAEKENIRYYDVLYHLMGVLVLIVVVAVVYRISPIY